MNMSLNSVLAFIVWKGKSLGDGELTTDFATEARTRAIPVIEVSTR